MEIGHAPHARRSGYFGCDVRPFNPLLDALPRMFHASVSAESQQWLLALIRAGVDESRQGTAGSETMLARLAELMFIDVIRKYIARLPEHEGGVLVSAILRSVEPCS